MSLQKGKVHKDPDVDIAAIEITDHLLKKGQMKPYIDYLAFYKDQFPSAVKAGETDILIIGFPKSRNYIEDRRATTPDVRSGPIKSEWGSKSEGCAQFEVGTLTEEGFSGSPVILTKYAGKNIAMNWNHGITFSSWGCLQAIMFESYYYRIKSLL